jgi:hypothetical protein
MDADNQLTSIQMMPRTEYEKMARASKDWEDANVLVYDGFPNTRGAKVTASIAFDDYSKLRYSIAITEGKFSTISFENGEKITCSNNILFLGLSDALKLDINNQISDGEIQQIIEKSEPVMVSADAKSFDLGGGNSLESVGFDTNGNWSYWVKLPKLKQRAIKVQIEANWSKITKSELAGGTPNEKGVNQLKDYLADKYGAKFNASATAHDDEVSAEDVIAEINATKTKASPNIVKVDVSVSDIIKFLYSVDRESDMAQSISYAMSEKGFDWNDSTMQSIDSIEGKGVVTFSIDLNADGEDDETEEN